MKRSIVVGVDGSQPSDAALEWAAREAALRGCELLLLHAVPWPLVSVPVDPRIPAGSGAAEQLLAAAKDHAHRVAPGIEISGTIATESPAASLIQKSEETSLVVVGNRGHGGFVGLLAGSVALRVAGHASCPVVLVPRRRPHAERGLVVVGVGTDQTDAPLLRAFEAAAMRDARLRAVHGWWMPMPVDTIGTGMVPPAFPDPSAIRQQVTEVVEARVGSWQRKFPSVEVTVEVVAEHPRNALLDAAEHADLIVTGSHDTSGRHLMPLGSVASSIIHHSPCPVLIARNGLS